MTVSAGESRQLNCSVSNESYPRPATVLWKHGESYVSTGRVLQLRDIDKNQTGLYECIAYNGYGSPDTKTFSVTFGLGETFMSVLTSENNVTQTVLPVLEIAKTTPVSTDTGNAQTESVLPVSEAKWLQPLWMIYPLLHVIFQGLALPLFT